MNNFINDFVVGIDVSSKSSVVTILQPGGEQYGKKLKITNDLTGFNKLLFILNGICSNFSIKPKIFMESTGLYHILLYNYFSKSDFKCYILNPIHTKNFAKQSIRKVKNDKIDSLRIAQLAQSPTFSIDSSFDERYFVLKKLCREYDSFVSHKALYKKKLLSSLNLVFPKFNKIFGDTFSVIPLTILSHYPTYIDFLNADKNSVLELIISTVNHSLEWAEKKYKLILDVALEAKELKIQVSYLGSEIKCFIDIINHFDKACNKIKEDLSILHEEIPGLKHNVELLCSHPEVGFMSAVSFLSEIGDINNFKNAKKVVAFLGVDTSVSQSGDFTSTKNRLTKRGSRLGRKVLFNLAINSIKTRKNGIAANPVLLAYYKQLTQSKPKKVALCAVMHKLINHFFAILRDQKPFEMRLPETHMKLYINTRLKIVV